MRSVRQLYFYLMAFIGAEAMVWGTVALLRAVLHQGAGLVASHLSTGLAAVLVGLPVFLLHWLRAQANAAAEEQEAGSLLRAIFLYGARTAFLVPVFYSLLALLSRWLTQAMGLDASLSRLGGNQSPLDNLAALVVCLIAFGYFSRVLSQDWRSAHDHEYALLLQRLYRYIWAAGGLALTVAGVQHLLQYLLSLPAGVELSLPAQLAAGLALTLVGTPLWAVTWLSIQGSLTQPAERNSLLRQVVLHLLVLGGVGGVMAAGVSLLSGVLEWILGRTQSLGGLLRESAAYLGAGIPLALVWAYHSRVIQAESSEYVGAPMHKLVRNGFRFIYCALGLTLLVRGLGLVSGSLADSLSGAALVPLINLASGLAAILIGLPLWLFHWLSLRDQPEAQRSAVVRRAYLYGVVFMLVAGVMANAGALLFAIFSELFGMETGSLPRTVLQRVGFLIVYGSFLAYHLRVLQGDTRTERKNLRTLQQNFGVLAISDDAELSQLLSAQIRQAAADMPFALHALELGAPPEEFQTARALILPDHLALDPPEPLRLWLNSFEGRRVIIPRANGKWTLAGVKVKPAVQAVREAVEAVREMAEGADERSAESLSTIDIVGWVLAGLVTFIGLILLLSLTFQA